MNRLNRMTGLVLVIIGLFCACQGTAKQVDMETDLKAMYADLPFSMPDDRASCLFPIIR